MKKYGADQGTIKNGAFSATGTYAFQHPAGTGPYKFVSWTVGQKVELAKNASYWGPKAKLDRLIIRPIAANTARLQALQTGDVNAYDLAAPQDVPSITGNSSLKVIKRPAFNVAYVGINSARPPFNNKLVRQAVAYGLDRKSVVDNFYYGTGTVAEQFLPKGLFGWTNKVTKYPYDPDKAKALLRQARADAAGQGRVLVPDGRVAAVHAGPEAQLRGVRSEPRELRVQGRRRTAHRGVLTTWPRSTAGPPAT